MSEEQLKAFLEKVKADTSLQEKLNGAADADAVVEIAKDAGFSITAEDIQSMQSATVELSDEELEGVAGGMMCLGGDAGLVGCVFAGILAGRGPTNSTKGYVGPARKSN